LRLAELAELVGGEVRGDGERRVDAVRPLTAAGPADLSFLLRRSFRQQAVASHAGALLLGPDDSADPALAGRDLLVAADPARALVAILGALHPPPVHPPGVHPTAIVGAGCEIDPSAAVGPYAVIGEGTRIGAGAVVSAHAAVGRRCAIGAGALLHPQVVLYDDTEVGPRSVLHSGAVVGADGFGYVSRGGVHHKVPQVGRVVVESDVEIGANSAVDRATVGETRIGAGTKVDNLVQVGHNVEIGRGSLLCGQAGIAGSSRLGAGVVLGGQAGIADHLELGDGVQVAAASAVFQPVAAGAVAGIPAVEIGRWRRRQALLGRLQEMARTLRALRKRLGEEE
jgi:UDP-3-O-[3-hydroxymyristoyl] glucosamine N-acyltransferase